ncbi:MAG: DUF2804 domain-containing protein [Coriobacteriales bacterium]|nr:DUF2804 domain-containing protein [Coriobacteriales bacterium]
MSEHLITGSGPLLNEEGSLCEPGYALRPPFVYDHDQIAAPAWRVKDWDYYLVSDSSYALALTFSDLGYIGLVSAAVIDLAAPAHTTTSELVLLPMGKMGLPASSETGDIEWSNRRCTVSFRHVGGGRRLTFTMKQFKGEDDLEAELLLDEEPQDSMVIVTPWAENPQAFYYNRKIIGMRARGGFRVGDFFHEFDGSEALGLLDWGRGVWTYDNTWYWGSAMGWQENRVIGFNIGYGFGDTSAASENIMFVDGVGHKLGRLTFGIPQDEEGSYLYMKPWHIVDDEGRLDLTFTPTIDRSDLIDVLHLVVSDQHQVFGTFDGSAVLDDGSILAIDGLRGFAERVHNRY